MEKLPRTYKQYEEQLAAAANRAYDRGYGDGRKAAEKHISSNAHCAEALKQMTQLASVYGQLMDTLSRAMQSEAGQL